MSVRNAYELTWTEAKGLKQWEQKALADDFRDREKMRSNRERLG